VNGRRRRSSDTAGNNSGFVPGGPPQPARLALVERKLDAVLDHLGVDLPEPHLERVEDLLGQGRTIQAIKAYREATGADLRDAKEAVDRLGERR
jgi:hypothetical protein